MLTSIRLRAENASKISGAVKPAPASPIYNAHCTEEYEPAIWAGEQTMQRTATLPVLSADGGLAKYLTEIRKFPILRPEQEMAYARRWREQGDREAAYHLVTSHLRLVAKIAMRYRGYGLPIADIISEGNLGLMHAVKRFDPQRGVRLATYAMWWIKATIHEYILRSWSLVKIGASSAQKKLFFKLRRTRAEISALEEGDLRPEHAKLIAGRLGVKESEVIEMNRRLAGDISLNAPVNGDPDSDRLNNLLELSPSQEVAHGERQEENLKRAALTAALDVLNPRERGILEARWLSEEPAKLEQLAARYGVSRERIRQIELRAFEKVRASVMARMASDLTGSKGSILSSAVDKEPAGGCTRPPRPGSAMSYRGTTSSRYWEGEERANRRG